MSASAKALESDATYAAKPVPPANPLRNFLISRSDLALHCVSLALLFLDSGLSSVKGLFSRLELVRIAMISGRFLVYTI